MEIELDYLHLLTFDIPLWLLWYERRLVLERPIHPMVLPQVPDFPVACRVSR